MSPERWQQIEKLYDAAFSREPAERARFLDAACAGDDELRKEVEWMLAHQPEAQAFIDAPALDAVARTLAATPSRSLAGASLGPYRELSLIGKGGMGEVYKAHDSRLHRYVAIKVLPQHVSTDPQLQQRFRREAQTLAKLSHPHICPVFDVGEHDGVSYLVMEFLEGETLAERLQKGAFNRDATLKIGMELADALDKAHSHGIVHRDLKPSNVMLTKGGSRLLDFGLARLRPDRRSSHLSTLSGDSSVTAPGTIVGTLQYMAPEQLEGKESDARTDVFSLGLILYEMASGRKPFAGDSQAALISAIMQCSPPALESVDEKLRHVVERCLMRDPDDRWQTAKDVRAELMWAAKLPASGTSLAAKEPPVRIERLAWVAVTLALVLLAAFFAVRALRVLPPAAEIDFNVETLPTADPVSIAISPDGQKIVFAGASEGKPRLWLRPLSSINARQLPGTEGAFYPFWALDNRSIAFFADAKLKVLDIESGFLRTLADAPNPLGGTWGRDDYVFFSPSVTGPIFRVPASGGKAEPVTRIEGKLIGHSFPQFLPDGRHFLFYSTGEPHGIYVGELGTSGIQRLPIDTNSQGAYAASGHVLFVSRRTLFAQEFDAATLSLRGKPFPIVEQVGVDAANIAAVSVSAAGPIIYRSGNAAGQRQLIWFDRSGKQIKKVESGDPSMQIGPDLSRDGRYVALQRLDNAGNQDVWLLDLLRDKFSRLTSDAGQDGSPVWSPDGARIVFHSSRSGTFDLYEKSAAGTSPEELLLHTPQPKMPNDWSTNGDYILYRSPSPKTGFDIWALPLDRTGKEFPVVQTEFDERDGQFSPDGKWIAFQSNESGRFEIVLQPFPSGSHIPVSSNGGFQVRWRRDDGKELFFIAPDGRLMAVPIAYSNDGKTIEPGTPVPLFPAHVGPLTQGGRQQYAVTANGQSFLINTLLSEIEASPITVLLNWSAARRQGASQ